MDENEKYLEPTVVQVDNIKDSLIVEESFGPLIPIHPVQDLDEAIRIANEVSDTSLGIYPFGDKRETARSKSIFYSSLPRMSNIMKSTLARPHSRFSDPRNLLQPIVDLSI